MSCVCVCGVCMCRGLVVSSKVETLQAVRQSPCQGFIVSWVVHTILLLRPQIQATRRRDNTPSAMVITPFICQTFVDFLTINVQQTTPRPPVVIRLRRSPPAGTTMCPSRNLLEVGLLRQGNGNEGLSFLLL